MISSSKRSQTSSLRSSVQSKQRYQQKSRKTSFVENLIFEYKTQSNKKPMNQTLKYEEQSVSLRALNSKPKVVKSISKQNSQSYILSSQKNRPQLISNQSVIHFPLRQSNGLQSYKSTQIKQDSNFPVNMTSRKSGTQTKRGSLMKNITGMDSQYESQLLRNIYYNNNSNNTRREQLFKKPKGKIQADVADPITTRGRNDDRYGERSNTAVKISKQHSIFFKLKEELNENFDKNVISCIQWLIAERRQDGLNLLLTMKKSLKDFVLGAGSYCAENNKVMQGVQLKEFISLCLYDLFIVNDSTSSQQKLSSTPIIYSQSNKVSEKLEKKYLLLVTNLQSIQNEQQCWRMVVIETYYLLSKVNYLNRILMQGRKSTGDEQVINKIVIQIKSNIHKIIKVSNGNEEWIGIKLISVLIQMINQIIVYKQNQQLNDDYVGNFISLSKTLLTYTLDLQYQLTQKQQHVKLSSNNLLYLSLLIISLISQTLVIISNRIRCELFQSAQFAIFNPFIFKQTLYCNALRQNLTQPINIKYDSNSIDSNIIATYLQYLKNLYRTKMQYFVLFKAIIMTVTIKQEEINNNTQNKIHLLKCIVSHLEPQIKLLNQFGKQFHFSHNQNLIQSPNNHCIQTIQSFQIKDQYLFCAIYFARVFVSYYQILEDIDCIETQQIYQTLLLKRVSILQALKLSIVKVRQNQNYLLTSLQLWLQEKVMQVYYQLGEISSMGEIVIQWFAGRLRGKVQQQYGLYSPKSNPLQRTNDYYQSNLYSLYISYKSTLILTQLLRDSQYNTDYRQIDQYKRILQLSLFELIEKVEGLSRGKQLGQRKELLKVFIDLWGNEELRIEQQVSFDDDGLLQLHKQLQIAQLLTLAHLSIQLLRHSSSHYSNSPSPLLRTFADEQSDNQYSDYSYDRSSSNTVYENDEIKSNSQVIAAKYTQLTGLAKPTQYHTNYIKSTLSNVSNLLSKHKLSSPLMKNNFSNILNNLKEDYQILLSYFNDL